MSHDGLLATLLKNQSPSDFDAYDIASKAYHRASRKQPLEAAVLFEAAAKRAQEMFDSGEYDKRNEHGVRINQALNHWARAGFHFHKAGEEAHGLELMQHCVAADWLAAGLNHDLMTVGRCWEYLVKAAVPSGPEAFETAFARATQACGAIGEAFPLSHPTRKELSGVARGWGMEELAQELVAPLRTTRPMKRELKAWLKAFDAAAP